MDNSGNIQRVAVVKTTKKSQKKQIKVALFEKILGTAGLSTTSLYKTRELRWAVSALRTPPSRSSPDTKISSQFLFPR